MSPSFLCPDTQQVLNARLRNECVNTRKAAFRALAQDGRLLSPQNYRPERGPLPGAAALSPGDPGDHLAGLDGAVVPEASFLHIIIVVIIIATTTVTIITTNDHIFHSSLMASPRSNYSTLTYRLFTHAR